MSRVCAVANQKGGVGKTTTAVNLAAAVALSGRRVLLVDLDPQGNTTSGLGVSKKEAGGIYDVLMEDIPLAEVVKKTEIPLLDVVPSTMDLAGAELELVNVPNREYKLSEALKAESAEYDYIFIDCPPSLSLLTLNAFTASHGVLVPIQCEFYALEGLSQLVNTVQRVRQTFNRGLGIDGVILTMYNSRTNLSMQVTAEVKKYFKNKVYETVIPRNVRLSEAPGYGKPIFLFDASCTGAVAYAKLGKEFLMRTEGKA